MQHFSHGDRVQLSPATNAWMMGDRYGHIVKIGRKYLHVGMDRSGRTLKVSPDLLTVVSSAASYNRDLALRARNGQVGSGMRLR